VKPRSLALDYRIVHPADQTLVLKQEYWPANAKWILPAFLMSDEGKAMPDVTPRFILAQDHKIVLTFIGNDGWKNRMWPKILELRGPRPSVLALIRTWIILARWRFR
jgi:hypothetical protein